MIEQARNDLDARHDALAETFDVDCLKLLNEGGWANGDVFLAQRNGRQMVIKTYRRKPAVIRSLGRYLLARERRAYRMLEGLEGVPSLLDFDDRTSLATEYIAGDKISQRVSSPEASQAMESVRKVIAAMHGRGVYHMDLRNQGNILVDRDNRATVLDFASAIIVRGGNPISRGFAALCRRYDLYGLSKWEGLARALA